MCGIALSGAADVLGPSNCRLAKAPHHCHCRQHRLWQARIITPRYLVHAWLCRGSAQRQPGLAHRSAWYRRGSAQRQPGLTQRRSACFRRSMSNGVTFCDREVVEDHNHRPRGFQIAHINRMVICHLWGVREKRNSKRAQKIKLNKLSGSRLALCVNRVKKRLSEPLHARSRLGGGCLSIVKLSRHHSVVGRSPIHRSDPLT